MTIEDFNKTSFSAGMKATYKGREYNILSLNFEELLFGIAKGKYCRAEDLIWIRCENAEVE